MTSRGRKGVQVIRDVKSNPYRILNAFELSSKSMLGIKTIDGDVQIKASDLPIVDRYSTGSLLSKKDIEMAYIIVDLEKLQDQKQEDDKNIEPTISLQNIDNRFMTIDDFLNNFDLEEK